MAHPSSHKTSAAGKRKKTILEGVTSNERHNPVAAVASPDTISFTPTELEAFKERIKAEALAERDALQLANLRENQKRYFAALEAEREEERRKLPVWKPGEFFELGVKGGIWTPDGQLTDEYK